MSATIDVGLTRREIDQLATYHRECEARFVEMREYGMAEREKNRTMLFEGLQKTGAYQRLQEIV